MNWNNFYKGNLEVFVKYFNYIYLDLKFLEIFISGISCKWKKDRICDLNEYGSFFFIYWFGGR